MREIPEADTLEEFVSREYQKTYVRTITNLILSHGNNLGAIKPDTKDTSRVTARKIANERSCLPVPYLHDGVVTATDDPLFVHAHAPHKPSVGIGVTLETKHPSLTRYGTVGAGPQNDPVTTSVTHSRDRGRQVLFIDAGHELQVGFGGGGTVGRRYNIQFFAGRPAFAGVDVNQPDVVVR